MKDIASIEALIDDPNWLKEKEEAESIFDNPEKMKAVKQYLEKRENYKVPQEVIDFDVSLFALIIFMFISLELCISTWRVDWKLGC